MPAPIKLFSSIEDSSRMILMIGWDSVEAHNTGTGYAGIIACGRSIRAIKRPDAGAQYRVHEVKS